MSNDSPSPSLPTANGSNSLLRRAPALSSTNTNAGTLLEDTERYIRLRRNLSFALLAACPLLLCLPPRNLNMYSFSLAGMWGLAIREVSTKPMEQGEIMGKPRQAGVEGVGGEMERMLRGCQEQGSTWMGADGSGVGRKKR